MIREFAVHFQKLTKKLGRCKELAEDSREVQLRSSRFCTESASAHIFRHYNISLDGGIPFVTSVISKISTMGFFQMIEAAFGLSRKSARILVIGLDNSGKSTIIHHLKPKKVRNSFASAQI